MIDAKKYLSELQNAEQDEDWLPFPLDEDVNQQKSAKSIKPEITWTPQQAGLINTILANKEDSFVIEGGPGSGKTLIGIDMAEKIAKSGDIVLHLMYNVPLSQYVNQCTDVGKNQNITTLTYHKWIHSFYRDFGLNVPQEFTKEYKVDWNKIEKQLVKANLGIKYDVVITDETQDFPIELIRILRGLSERMVCFIDPNQSYEDDKTSVEELLDELDLSEPKRLTYGYRTTKQIMDAATIFKTDKSLSFVSEKRGNYPYPKMICCYDPENRFEAQNHKILELIKSNPGKDIGIIVNARNRASLLNEFRKNGIDYTYHDPDNAFHSNPLDFTVKGVKVVTFGTMKGLNFDIVIIPNVELIKSKNDSIKNNNLMYVAMTRASEELYMLYSKITTNTEKWTNAAKIIKDNQVLFDWE